MRWTDEQITTLMSKYPHFGGQLVADELKLSLRPVRAKADKLKLRMLPRCKRFCISCRNNRLSGTGRRTGSYCLQCFNENRKRTRRRNVEPPTILERLNELARSARYRSSVATNIDGTYLTGLYHSQDGRCYYSGMEMELSPWGKGRTAKSMSIDRVDSNGGYTKDNIVLCCWAVNAGKSNLSEDEYIGVCRAVVEHSAIRRRSTAIVLSS